MQCGISKDRGAALYGSSTALTLQCRDYQRLWKADIMALFKLRSSLVWCVSRTEFLLYVYLFPLFSLRCHQIYLRHHQINYQSSKVFIELCTPSSSNLLGNSGVLFNSKLEDQITGFKYHNAWYRHSKHSESDTLYQVYILIEIVTW